MQLKHLKSGTDVRGTAVCPDASEKIDLTDEVVCRIVAGFIRFLETQSGKPATQLKVSVGHDSRVSAARIRALVLRQLTAMQVAILDCGLCSTPAMFMTTQTEECSGAVQITASHHPWDRNGLKFFTCAGGISGAQLETILQLAEADPFSMPGDAIQAEPMDYLAKYCKQLREMICAGVQSETDAAQPLRGLKIVVDAGNGVGGFYAEQVLAPLGADTTGSCFLDPDGRFPNHIPNPENAEAMECIRRATLAAKADLGVIFDTDVDRGGAVTADGEALSRNRLVAAAAAIALADNPGGTIVTDSVTSAGLTTFIETTLGGKHLRFKRGYKNVIDEAARRCAAGENAPLAIETSGHAAFRENFFLDDGAYLVTRIIIKLCQLKRAGKSLHDLTSGLQQPAEEQEIRIQITAPEFQAYGEKIIAAVEACARTCGETEVATDSFEGTKILFPAPEIDGFFILRLSVHDPILPVNFEAAQAGGVAHMARMLQGWLAPFDALTLAPLEQICGKMIK